MQISAYVVKYLRLCIHNNCLNLQFKFVTFFIFFKYGKEMRDA